MINPISSTASVPFLSEVAHSSTAEVFSKVAGKIEALEESISSNGRRIEGFINGSSSIPTHELVIRMEATRLDMALALQVKNKIVETVQEIYRTQI